MVSFCLHAWDKESLECYFKRPKFKEKSRERNAGNSSINGAQFQLNSQQSDRLMNDLSV